MSESVRATQAFYGRWARLYDRLATAPGVTSWRERVVDSLSLAPGDTVVEMGCGTGANLPHLRRAVGPAGTVVGIDLVGEMLGEAARRIDRRGWENVHVIQGDATAAPVSRADAVLSTFLLGMLADPGSAVKDWVARTRPGGRVAIMNATRSSHPVGRPLNLAFRLFVRAGAPGARTRTNSPAEELERRWAAAETALFEETTDHERGRQGLGFVVFASGQVPE